MILVDTSGVLAAIDPRQTHHVAAARVLMRPQRRILSPFVLAELDYLIAARAGLAEELTLLGDVAAGAYELVQFNAQELAAAMATIERYADLQLGLADASLAVLARRYRCRDVLTLDQRHFRVVLGPDDAPFRMLPFDDSSDG